MPEYTFFAERTQEKAWICRISCHRRNDMTAEEIKKKDSEYIIPWAIWTTAFTSLFGIHSIQWRFAMPLLDGI